MKVLDWIARRAARRQDRREGAVLAALDSGRPAYGLDLMRATGLRSGSLYPALDRLERAGVIESWWASGPYPRRRYYQLRTRPRRDP